MHRRTIQICAIIALFICGFICITIMSLPVHVYSDNLRQFIRPHPPPTMNVAFVCAGEKTIELIRRAAKTLLFHRTTPAHIHIIGDHPCYSTLTTMVRYWNATDDVTVSFYPWVKHTAKVEWLPTTHYSGIYGILKLLLPEILPDAVKEVILLDTDIVLNADIHELWGYFRKMEPEQLIGVATELSPWYQKSSQWPAQNGVGFNTGVLLLNLERMRERNWEQIWKCDTLKPLAMYKKVVLGDQDIFNVVAKERPELIYELPCTWNVQWREDRHPCLSPEISPHLKILHFNLPSKNVAESLRTPEFVALMKKVDEMEPPS